jgi:hypothetical protein
MAAAAAPAAALAQAAEPKRSVVPLAWNPAWMLEYSTLPLDPQIVAKNIGNFYVQEDSDAAVSRLKLEYAEETAALKGHQAKLSRLREELAAAEKAAAAAAEGGAKPAVAQHVVIVSHSYGTRPLVPSVVARVKTANDTVPSLYADCYIILKPDTVLCLLPNCAQRLVKVVAQAAKPKMDNFEAHIGTIHKDMIRFGTPSFPSLVAANSLAPA